MKLFTAGVALLCVLATASSAQDVKPDDRTHAEDAPAYRLLHAREVAAEAELNKVLTMYTPSFPAVPSKQFELDVIRREAAKMLLTAPERLDRLSEAYGDMILRRIALEVEVRDALTTYTSRHPLVREKLSALSRAEREAAKYLR